MDEQVYREYVAILKEELQPAMGCTEPIAVAYCAALARQTLGAQTGNGVTHEKYRRTGRARSLTGREKLPVSEAR